MKAAIVNTLKRMSIAQRMIAEWGVISALWVVMRLDEMHRFGGDDLLTRVDIAHDLIFGAVILAASIIVAEHYLHEQSE